MTNEPIQRLEIENYGCIQKATFQLTPLHALIGPNDSGKSTALRALRTVAALGSFHLEDVTPVTLDSLLNPEAGTRIEIRYPDRLGYSVSVTDTGVEEAFFDGAESIERRRPPHPPDYFTAGSGQTVAVLNRRRTMPVFVRFDGSALREPSSQLVSNEPICFFSDKGKGLASIYQALNSRDVDAFVALRNRVRELFPTIQNLLVPTVEHGNVVLQVRLTSGVLVPAETLSEGLLYFLAYAALQHIEGSRLFLVEEPENGLHPSRIAEVVRILREISKTAQVLIATHSPLVINELQGDEVTVVTRHVETGTKTILLKDVPGFEDAMKVYQPGEFWVSYADGKSEEPLLTGTPRQ